MSYIEENLLPDEHVVYRAALHWIIVARAILVLVGGLVLVFVPGAAPAGLVVLLVGALMLVPPFVAYRTTELGVTNKRVIVKTGWCSAGPSSSCSGKSRRSRSTRACWAVFSDSGRSRSPAPAACARSSTGSAIRWSSGGASTARWRSARTGYCCCWALTSASLVTMRSGGRAGTSRKTGRSMWRISSRSVAIELGGTTSVMTSAFSVSRATPR